MTANSANFLIRWSSFIMLYAWSILITLKLEGSFKSILYNNYSSIMPLTPTVDSIGMKFGIFESAFCS